MARFELQISWSNVEDLALKEVRVYVSDSETAKGDHRATVLPEVGKANVEVTREAIYWIRALAVNRAGLEEDWRLAAVVKKVVSRREDTPSALSNVSVAPVVPSSSVRVQVDPPSANEPPTSVEVIRGPDADRGALVGTFPVERAGLGGEAGEGEASVALALEPGLGAGSTEALHVRGVTPGGKVAGAATSVTVGTFDLPGHAATVIASIVGAVLTNFTAAATTDPWEVDGANGVTLKRLPALSALSAAEWGQGDSGLFVDEGLKLGQRYMPTGTVVMPETDLGSEMDFVLECYDETQLDTPVGLWPSTPGTFLARFPAFPTGDDDLRDRELGLGPNDLLRTIHGDGVPRRPIAPWQHRWEYEVSVATPLGGTWTRYVPGIRLHGRYIAVRLVLDFPVAWHKTIVPKAYVRVWTPLDIEIETKASGFTPGELNDITDASLLRQIGVVTGGGTEEIQVNIGGTVFGFGSLANLLDRVEMVVQDPAFAPGDLNDVETAAQKQIGIRTNGGNETFAVNIGGTVFEATLT